MPFHIIVIRQIFPDSFFFLHNYYFCCYPGKYQYANLLFLKIKKQAVFSGLLNELFNTFIIQLI